jgi:ABC-2 type transport system ATP-binding protein
VEKRTPNSVIKAEGLVKRYGDRVALNGVSFSVREGEIFGLLGPNGAGKTTLISILATLLPPDEGQVLICGYDLRREADRIRPLIGFVPQELALYPTLSAWDNLAFFGRIYGLRGTALKERIAAVLDLVGLRDRAGDAVRTFSGGMKRRLNIAAGLIHRPRLLLLDEPTVGVDPQSRNFIFEHIERLRSEGMTILYTTHYMEEAERLCDRVAIMDEGRILALDTPRGLIGLLGGGVIHMEVAAEHVEDLLPAVRALPHVQAASSRDRRLRIETRAARPALLELIELCNARDIPILSLEVLEPNLESVFLHLTGKRLRD